MTKPSDLNIVIYGHAGTGKSTLLAVLYKALLDNGFENVSINDKDGDFFEVANSLDARIDMLKKRSVNLKTSMVSKPPVVNEELMGVGC